VSGWNKVQGTAEKPFLLEQPVGEEEDRRRGDVIPDVSAVQSVDLAVDRDFRAAISKLLAELSPREERVLRMRFGIGMSHEHMLEEAGRRFNVTRERIRRIEGKALRKLREDDPARQLAEALQIPLCNIGKVRKIANAPLSLEQPAGEEEGGQQSDVIPDNSAVQSVDLAVDRDFRDVIASLFAGLSPREERALRMRFGIGTGRSTCRRKPGGCSTSPGSAFAGSRARRCASCARATLRTPCAASSTAARERVRRRRRPERTSES